MAKLTKRFKFSYSFTRTTVKNLRTVAERLIVDVSCVGYCNTSVPLFDEEEQRYTVDIEEVIYEGKDVFKLIEFLGQDTEIAEAATREAFLLFTSNLQEA